MQKGWFVVIGLAFIIIIGFGALFFLPNTSKAPTTGHASTSSSTTPAPSVLDDVIEVDSPLPNTTVTSPLMISGKARGNWYFEASAPVELKDSSGTVVGHGHITAQGDWTTTDYVPFIATLTFSAPTTHTGTLVLMNDNPSGDPKNQKELDIPIEF